MPDPRLGPAQEGSNAIKHIITLTDKTEIRKAD